MFNTQRDKMAWTSFTIVCQRSYLCSGFEDHSYNINTCKDHEISKVHFSKAPRCPTDAIFYCILVVLSIRCTAVLDYKLKVQLGKWDNNLTLSYNRFTDASSVSNCHAVAASRELWILTLETNGDWVFQQTILSLLCSGRTGWSWWKTKLFWGLPRREVPHGSTQ